ncbi:hypothetical protein MHM83_09275 [Tenacibaculum sp. Mcav3-52]|uniref:Uncharacterized protein n=1 Tax=Tenacibaculum sp. Pbs-1 TaxID=3238748 RepID=A0AB33L0E2_9FLAO|nr:hypothetical protein [Tenacibaculum sp. Mcav3-52]MCG7502060.1 hypothetical protein [Tenacibaculum sp. Mcav3-52]
MKIEKIKNYNQKLLAILGTIAGIFLIIALVSFISIVIQEHRRYNYEEPETGVLSKEKIEKLQKENKREQVISYETPILIDTLNSQYIIPVSHKTLNEKEDIGLNGLLNAYSDSGSDFSVKEKRDERYSREYYGEYNNIIVFDEPNSINKKLFKKRINFNEIKSEYFNKEILILLKASDKDTFKDGVINLRDLTSLYIYSIKENKIRKIGIEGMDVYNYKFINKSKNLIIEFGIDKNKNGAFESYNEPIILKKYNFEKEKLVAIVDEKINSELQKKLEGTEK